MSFYTFEHWTRFERRYPSKRFFKNIDNAKLGMVQAAEKELAIYCENFHEEHSFSHELTWDSASRLVQKVYTTERITGGNEVKSIFRIRLYELEKMEFQD